MRGALMGVGLSVVSTMAWSGPVRAEPASAPEQAQTFTLDDATRALLSQHPALRAGRHQVGASRSDLEAAALWQNPSLSVWWQKSPKRYVGGGGWAEQGYTTAALTQFVELTGVPGAKRQVARHEVEAARGDYTALVSSLTLDLEQAAIELASAQRNVEVYEQLVALLIEGSKLVHEAFAAGDDPAYDAARIDVTLVDAQANVLQSRAALVVALGEFRNAVGPAARSLSGRLELDLHEAPTLPVLQQLLTEFASRRGDVIAARERAKAALGSVGVAKRSIWQGVSLSAYGAYGNSQGQVDLGAGIDVPLPAVNYGQGTIRAAEQRASAELAGLDVLQNATLLRIEQQREQVELLRENAAAYRDKGVAASNLLLSEAQIAFIQKHFTGLELADAYETWRDTHLRVVELAVEARKAEVELGRLIGHSLRNPAGVASAP